MHVTLHFIINNSRFPLIKNIFMQRKLHTINLHYHIITQRFISKGSSIQYVCKTPEKLAPSPPCIHVYLIHPTCVQTLEAYYLIQDGG